MNQKANYIFNLSESIMVSFVAIILYLSINTVIPSTFLLYSALVLELFIVLIEVFLFFLYKKLFKFLCIIYLAIEIIFTFYINSYFPFYGIIIVVFGSYLKSILRIIFSTTIYVSKEYDRYLKMFHLYKDKKRSTRKKKVLVSSLVTSKSIKVKNKKVTH